MIFPNSPVTNNAINATHIPQFFNPSAISLPLCYAGTQINYRDSSWLKLNVCELFIKKECPNVDNCSLAHPPGTVKIENNTVTVCYDYIKKKDCKHGNCKYYHPHDALASAILRRGDDSKKNGINRSHDLLNISNANILSSQIHNANLITDQQMKAKLEVMRQLNAVNASAWLPGLNVGNAQTLANPTNQTNASLHTLLPGVSAKSAVLSQLGAIASASSAIAMHPSVGPNMADTKVSIKRAAIEAFGPNSGSSVIHASNDNRFTGMSDVKKMKQDDTMESVGAATDKIDSAPSSDQAAPSMHQYIVPQMINGGAQYLQSPTQLTLPNLAGANINGAYNILHNSTPIQTSTMSPYAQLSPLNLNNIMFQSLLTNPTNLQTSNHNLDQLLGFSAAQKLYPLAGTYPQVNVAQYSLLNQLYYQQLYQNSLTNPTQMLYPGSINLAELQQRSFEETSVAFINDKGTILETLPVCKDFLQGKCKRNQSCNYVHLLDSNVEVKDNKLTVCKNALKGQCHRPVCKFYHIPSYQLQKLGFSA